MRLENQQGVEIEPIPMADLNGVRVLIVDDNATNREILVKRLSSWGMRPVEVSSVSAALAELHEAVDAGDAYPLAIIDMQMPDVDGASLGQSIKSDPELMQTRMVMLTSLGRRGDAKHFEEIGFDAFANKPIRHNDFFLILTRVMSGDPASRSHSIVTRHSARESLQHYEDTGVRALVVDDNAINQQVAVGSLKRLGGAGRCCRQWH